ncbi:MAG: hypothetical protein ACREOG_10500 [Gemmatimonadaceae bacterium]
MNKTTSLAVGASLLAVAALMAGCANDAPVAPNLPNAMPAQLATLPGTDTDGVIATLQRVTARYHNLNAAIADDFVLLHPCENRPGEGPVGIVYVNIARLLDGVIDPETPDALIYEPQRNGRERLVGVEFAIPYALWTAQQPPQFLGATFQREDEFGVFALHVWVWRNNPEGLFAETNPKVFCAAE